MKPYPPQSNLGGPCSGSIVALYKGGSLAVVSQQREELLETSAGNVCREQLRSETCRMRLFFLISTLVFLLKEAQAWGFKNGIFHNSIWLGNYFLLSQSFIGSQIFDFTNSA